MIQVIKQVSTNYKTPMCLFQASYGTSMLQVVRETYLDEELRNDLIAMANELKIPVDSGLTMCADDFYEGEIKTTYD